jgi:hypothetical protein
MLVRLIDAKQQAREVERVRQKLRFELFEQCCELQRNPDSVDLNHLANLLWHLKKLEGCSRENDRHGLPDPRD